MKVAKVVPIKVRVVIFSGLCHMQYCKWFSTLRTVLYLLSGNQAKSNPLHGLPLCELCLSILLCRIVLCLLISYLSTTTTYC